MTNEESLDERIINESKEEIFTRYHLYREFFGKLWWLNELLELVVSKCREEFEKESITPSYNQLLREQGAELEHQKIIGIIKQKIEKIEREKEIVVGNTSHAYYDLRLEVLHQLLEEIK